MLIVCSILLAIDASGIPFLVRGDVEGKILKESQENYLVDFSKGVTSFKLAGKPEDYKKVLIKKTDCVKE